MLESMKLWPNAARNISLCGLQNYKCPLLIHGRLKREEEERKLAEKTPKLQEQFADAKRQLAQVSEEDWLNLPEPGNLTGRKRQKRLDKLTPVPDSVLTMAKPAGYAAQIDPATGLQTPAVNGGLTDLSQIGEARGAVLGSKLDQVSSLYYYSAVYS